MGVFPSVSFTYMQLRVTSLHLLQMVLELEFLTAFSGSGHLERNRL